MEKFTLQWSSLTIEDINEWMGEEGYRYCHFAKPVVEEEDLRDIMPTNAWMEANDCLFNDENQERLAYFIVIIDYFNYLGQTDLVNYNTTIPHCNISYSNHAEP